MLNTLVSSLVISFLLLEPKSTTKQSFENISFLPWIVVTGNNLITLLTPFHYFLLGAQICQNINQRISRSSTNTKWLSKLNLESISPLWLLCQSFVGLGRCFYLFLSSTRRGLRLSSLHLWYAKWMPWSSLTTLSIASLLLTFSLISSWLILIKNPIFLLMILKR